MNLAVFSTFLQRAWSWLCSFLVTQLCLSLCSWPILLFWGLPFAPLTFVGNMVFGPFLTIFLLLSLILTLGSLCAIPTDWAACALEYMLQFWLWITHQVPEDCYWAYPQPPLVLALLAPVGVLLIMHFRPLKSQNQKLTALFSLTLLLMITFKLWPLPDHAKIPLGTQSVCVMRGGDSRPPDQLDLFDPGSARRIVGSDTWCMYTLLQGLVRKFGALRVHTYHMARATPSTIAHLCCICRRKMADRVVLELPVGDGIKSRDKKRLEELESLKCTAAENGVILEIREIPPEEPWVQRPVVPAVAPKP